jgi:hypothetical protein
MRLQLNLQLRKDDITGSMENMTRRLTGGCLCGALRYECDSEPKEVSYCHCPDCRRTTGSAFCVGVAVDADALNILSGSVKEYTKTADSGNRITRQFCPECGSPLFTKVDAFPDLVWLKAGSLDEPEWVKPTHQTWTNYAVAWAHIDDDLPGFSKGGPPPEE